MKTRNKAGSPFLQFLFKTVMEVLPNTIRREKETKDTQMEKEDIKLSLFTDDIIIYMKNPTEMTKEVLELVRDYSKAAGYKVNMQKLIAFRYTSNEHAKFEIKNTMPFIVAPPVMK